MKQFNHTRPVRNEAGEKTGEKSAPVSRATSAPLGGQFGKDKKRRLVVTLRAGDVIEFRPEKTRRAVTVTATDMYRFAIRCQVNSLERRAKEIQKRDGGRLATARNKAKQEGL